MQMVALKKLRYPRRGPDAVEYDAGTEFTVASEKDAKMFALVRMAREVDAKAATKTPPAAKPAIKTRVMAPETPATPSAPTAEAVVAAEPSSGQDFLGETPRGNRYRRSDMRSED